MEIADDLPYQQRVLLTLYEISKRSEGEEEYNVKLTDGDMIIIPSVIVEGRKITLTRLRVSDENIFGRDKDVVNGIKKKLEEFFPEGDVTVID